MHPTDRRRERGPRRRWAEREGILLDDLEQIFLETGFSGWTVANLAARLRVSQATLYKLAAGYEQASGKQALIELVIDRFFRRTGEKAYAALEGVDEPADRVRRYLGSGAVAAPNGCLDFSRDIEENPGTREIYSRYQKTGMAVLVSLIEEGIRARHFRPVSLKLVMHFADAAYTRFRDPAVLEVLELTQRQAIDELASILLVGIAES